MGKNQHSKDRLFVTATEWREQYGGKKKVVERIHKSLPFDCCAMSMRPFQHPMLTPDGIVFDLLNIVPYVRKYKKNPVTGAALKTKDLVKLHFAKNNSGKYHDPVTYKEFGPHTRIVAIRTSGHVYAFGTVKRLNYDAHNMKDIMTNTPFTRKDVVTIQDPSNPALRQYTLLPGVETPAKHATKKPGIRNTNVITQRVMEQMKKKEAEKEAERTKAQKRKRQEQAAAAVAVANDPEKQKAARHTARLAFLASQARKTHNISVGTYSGSFTSSSISVDTKQKAAALTDAAVEELRYARVKKLKKKGYVRLVTNMGNLNLEIACDIVPRTCENFIGLCRKNYYKGCIFHRLIKDFMIQGGDPTGTGTGGESLWGGKFKDEFHNRLSHNARGVLAMANAGKDTNGSQFYITFKDVTYLDYKHSVFGKLVGGADVLAKLENVPVDEDKRPKSEIKILSTPVFQDPFEEVDSAIQKEMDAEATAKDAAVRQAAREKEMKRMEKLRRNKKGVTTVGKYMSARSKSGGLFRSGVASGAGAGAGAGATATSDAGGKKRKKGEVVGFSPATLASTATLSDQMVMGKRKQRASRTTFNFSGW